MNNSLKYKVRCIHHFQLNLIYNIDLGCDLTPVIVRETEQFKTSKRDVPKVQEKTEGKITTSITEDVDDLKTLRINHSRQ